MQINQMRKLVGRKRQLAKCAVRDAESGRRKRRAMLKDAKRAGSKFLLHRPDEIFHLITGRGYPSAWQSNLTDSPKIADLSFGSNFQLGGTNERKRQKERWSGGGDGVAGKGAGRESADKERKRSGSSSGEESFRQLF